MNPTGADAETILADLELSRGLAIQLTVVGLLVGVVALALFAALYRTATGSAVTFRFASIGVGWENAAANLLFIVILATVVVVPHEWLHGLAIRYFGGEPRYGVGVAHLILPYAYATTNHRFGRDQFLVVLLTPLVVLSAVGVLVMIAFEWEWLVVPLTANAAGAVADLWMALTVLGYPSRVPIEDRDEGVRILGREADAPRARSVATVVWDALAGGSVATVGLLVLLGGFGPVVLGAIGVESLTLGTPGTPTYLFEFADSPAEFSVAVGPGVAILGAPVGVAYSFVRAYRRGGASAVSRTE